MISTEELAYGITTAIKEIARCRYRLVDGISDVQLMRRDRDVDITVGPARQSCARVIGELKRLAFTKVKLASKRASQSCRAAQQQ